MPLNEIQHLYDIAAIPIELNQVADVFPHMLQYAEKLFAVEAAVLYIEQVGSLVLKASHRMSHIDLPTFLPDPDDTIRSRSQAQERPFEHGMPAAGLTLRIGHDRLGWLYMARPKDFTEVETRLLAVFAERVAIMIHHARTQELIELERRQRKLAATLQDINLILTSRRSFEQILEQILTQVSRVLPYDTAGVWLMQDDNTLRFAYGIGYEKFQKTKEHSVFTADNSIVVNEIMMTKSSLIIPDTHYDERWEMKKTRPWIKSFAAAPILINDTFVGLFNVSHTQKNFYVKDHIQILESLTQLISIAAQNAHVYDEMRQALAQEKELNSLKTRFISTVSHEFRTPLSAILTYNQILEKYNGKLDQTKRRDYFQKIKGQIQYLTALLEDVLLLGKAESVGLELNPTSQGLVEFCEDIVKETSLFAPSNVDFTFDVSGNATDTLFDGKLMRHILFNLLSNAVKYSPNGGVIHFAMECNQQFTRITVSDEGIGIPEEEQQKLFESFFRASNVDDLPGTGLGLAIVKRAVDAYGGRIDMRSYPQKGTTFQVTLPYIPAAVTS